MTKSSDRSDPPIVMIGASVRPAVESARRSGIRTIAVDCFGDRETIQAADSWTALGDFTAFCRKFMTSSPASPPKIAIVGGLEGGYEFLGDCNGEFLGASPECFRDCDDPDFLESIARSAGVEFPETIRIRSDAGQKIIDEAKNDKNASQSWLVKRPSSCGGLGVRLLENALSTPESSELAEHSDPVLQRRIPGQVIGVSYLGIGDHAQLMGVCRLLKKRIGILPYIFAGAVGPISISNALSKRLQSLGQAFVKESPLDGPFNMDVVVSGEQIWLLEINPRWSGSMELVEHSWEEISSQICSFFAPSSKWIDLAEKAYGTDSKSTLDLPRLIKRVFFAKNDREVDPSELVKIAVGKGFWKDVPETKVFIKQSEPIATWIASLDRMSIQETFRLRV